MRAILLLWFFGGLAAADPRVILRTVAGDVVIAPKADFAPKTVEQFLKMVRAGIYDGTHFFRIEPGFVAQVSTAQDRLMPLDGEQKKILKPLALEATPGITHRPFTVSLAHADDPDSGETSFSVLLAAAPHLDGKYTVFGEVESGHEVFVEFMRVPRDSNNHPMTRLTVVRAEVRDSGDLGVLAPPKPIAIADAGRRLLDLRYRAGGLVLLLMLLCAAGGILVHRLEKRILSALFLLCLLVGGFLLMMLWMPGDGLTATLGFFATVGVFRAMSTMQA